MEVPIMNNYEIIKFIDNELELDVEVSPNEDTVWLTKEQMSLLFDRDRTVISKHINNIYKEEELDEQSTCAKNAQVQLEGKRTIVRTHKFYNLDVIISVGYRIKSNRGILFRKWANNVLKQYLLKGYVLDSNRIIVSKDNYLTLENDVHNLKEEVKDIKEKMFIEPAKERLFFNGQFYDAYDFISSLIERARNQIIVIDPYFNRDGLGFLKHAAKNTDIIICCSDKAKLQDMDIREFEKQYFKLKVVIDNTIHDRFMVIDKEEVYLIGTSLNYIGNKTFAVHKFENMNVIKPLIEKFC